MNQEQMQELDRILKLWAESPENSNIDLLKCCHHEPKVYSGFTEEYEFCVKCDAKKVDGIWVEKEKRN